MSKISHLLLEKEILLESGTNELEVLVFVVGDYVFGVNVAKVREVLPAPPITHLPDAHHSIRGVFKLRNQVIPCVSLADYLGIWRDSSDVENIAILTDLNQQQTAFLVDRVEKIHRLSWEQVLAVPGLKDLSQTPVTALARCENRLILMLDFEMILDQVTDQYFRTAQVENERGLPRETATIMLVEDSPTVREAIQQTLCNSGYTQLIVFENGSEAWEWLENQVNQGKAPCHLVIADIEMPQVDGLHLTKRIKTHPQLQSLPVLLYSSIITPENRRKGEAVGADAQVAKPDLCHVVQYADQLIFEKKSVSALSADQSPSTDQGQEIPTQIQMPVESQQSVQSSVGEGQTVVCGTAPATSQQSATTDINSMPAARSELCAVENKTEAAQLPETATAYSESQAEERGFISTSQLEEEASPAIDPGAENELLNAIECPPGVESHLWQTFITELQRRYKTLEKIKTTLEGEPAFDPARHFDLVVDLARTLHTIKSAAMVVPVDTLVRATHLLETRLETMIQHAAPWDGQLLDRYCAWLELFLENPGLDWQALKDIGERLVSDLLPPHETMESAAQVATSQG